MDIEKLWSTCLGELEVLLSKANFTTWFKETAIINIKDDTVVIGTPNAFTKDWLQKKFHQEILSTLNHHVGDVKKIEYILHSQGSKGMAHTTAPRKEGLADNINNGYKETNSIDYGEKPITTEIGQLNPKYCFDSFVVGESNRLAHAAALAVSKNPGVTYNPLFIYGGVGLGKTHLMQAIGNEIHRKDKKKKIIYTTSEKFTNEFISLIKKGKAEQFKNNYRGADVLLIDDIQFLAGKESTQEEFFHTFNDLHSTSKQIVMTSDRPPKAIAALEARLVSRFEWGMLADINPPDIETRIAILQNKAAEKSQDIDDEIINYIAKNIQNNIRELEGALNRILAHSELNNKTLSLDDVKGILCGSSFNDKQRNVSPKDLLRQVADFYDISVDEILGQKRNKELVYPRQILAYLLREELHLSFPKIGKELGGKDHTTIMHACSKISQELSSNDIIKHEINSIKERFFR
ncbi:MAG TPA: chromosomal replication initiator protein DnaA [Patescibacteria group bacterium]|nr:chromosomal replication initiator protein DnaA [Patescibacteria group bacterium]